MWLKIGGERRDTSFVLQRTVRRWWLQGMPGLEGSAQDKGRAPGGLPACYQALLVTY